MVNDLVKAWLGNTVSFAGCGGSLIATALYRGAGDQLAGVRHTLGVDDQGAGFEFAPLVVEPHRAAVAYDERSRVYFGRGSWAGRRVSAPRGRSPRANRDRVKTSPVDVLRRVDDSGLLLRTNATSPHRLFLPGVAIDLFNREVVG